MLPALPLARVHLPEAPARQEGYASEASGGVGAPLSPVLVLAVLCWTPPQFRPTLHPLLGNRRVIQAQL